MLKAIIFDMDDTLIDWSKRTQDWFEYERQHLELVFNFVLQEVYPVELGKQDDFYRLMRQLSRQAWLDADRDLHAPHMGSVLCHALEQIGVPSHLLDGEAVMRAYDWQPMRGVKPFPDVMEILPQLASQGVKLGLVTNAFQPMWMRDRELQAFGMLDWLQGCRLSAADVGYLKPHPVIFEYAIECLNARPDEIVFVGDNPEADIAGSQAVGMRAVLRVGPNLRTLISGLILPDGAINTMHELLPILDDWYPDWRKQPTLM